MISFDGSFLYSHGRELGSSQVSAGASTASFVAEDKFGDQEMYVGDDCEDCAEVQPCCCLTALRKTALYSSMIAGRRLRARRWKPRSGCLPI